jgi:hypothetical protein
LISNTKLLLSMPSLSIAMYILFLTQSILLVFSACYNISFVEKSYGRCSDR